MTSCRCFIFGLQQYQELDTQVKQNRANNVYIFQLWSLCSMISKDPFLPFVHAVFERPDVCTFFQNELYLK